MIFTLLDAGDLSLCEPRGFGKLGLSAAKARGGRVVALGTTVARALEHAARHRAGLRPGSGLATQRIGPGTPLRQSEAAPLDRPSGFPSLSATIRPASASVT